MLTDSILTLTTAFMTTTFDMAPNMFYLATELPSLIKKHKLTSRRPSDADSKRTEEISLRLPFQETIPQSGSVLEHRNRLITYILLYYMFDNITVLKDHVIKTILI